MVSLSFLIALVALIDATRGFAARNYDYFINLERCKKGGSLNELTCYIRASCLESSTDLADKGKLVKYNDEKLIRDDCDVIVQMRAFSYYRSHVMMQVNVAASDSPSDELNTTAGVSLVHFDPQIQCNSAGVTGRGVVSVDEYGTRQVNEKSLIFCSATISTRNQDSGLYSLFNVGHLAGNYPRVEFATTNSPVQKIDYVRYGDELWDVVKGCDDMEVITANQTMGDLHAFEISKIPKVLVCPIHPQSARPLRVRVEYDDVEFWADSVWCQGNTWRYKQGVKKSLTTHAIFVYCAIEFDKACAPLAYNDCPGCDNFAAGDGIVQCPMNIWRFRDGSAMDTPVECKQRDNELTSGWFRNYDGKEITEGGCSTEFYCPAFSSFNLSLPNPNHRALGYREADRSAGDKDFSCPTTRFNLTIESNGKARTATRLTCNTARGLYEIDSSGDYAARRSTVYCKGKADIVPDKPPPAVPMTAEERRNLAIGLSCGLGAVLLIGGIVLFFVRRHYIQKKLFYQRYPDGMMTAREINEDEEFVDSKTEKWHLKWLTASMRKAHEEEKLQRVRRYNEDGPITVYTSEVMPREGEFASWTVKCFREAVLPVIHRYSTENRLRCLRALTAFYHYSAMKPVPDFGTPDQLFAVIAACRENKMKCFESWDHIFALCKLIIVQMQPDPDPYGVPGRLKTRIVKISQEIVADVGYRQRPGETDRTKGLRVVAARLLLWAKDQKCMEELGKMAKLPLDQVESPIRMVVFSYAINNVPGKEQEIKDEFYADINRAEIPPEFGPRLGTYRQHLIYALCSTKDMCDGTGVAGSFKTLREIMAVLFENLRSFHTPTDLLYAYRGALDDAGKEAAAAAKGRDACSVAVTHGIFIKRASSINIPAVSDTLIETHKLDAEEQKRLTVDFKTDIASLLHLLADSASSLKEYEQLQACWLVLIVYATNRSLDLEPHLMQSRASNLPAVISELKCGYRTKWL